MKRGRDLFETAINHLQTRNFSEASRLCLELISQNPEDTDALHLLSVTSVELGDYDSALRYLERVVRIDPGNAEIYYHLGYVFQKKGQLDESMVNYRSAARINPAHPLVFYHLGTVYQSLQRFDEAIACYQKALQNNPRLPGAHYNFGTVFQAMKRFDEAIRCYRSALELNPGLLDPLYNMGLAYQEQGEREQAVAAYDRALGYHPGFVQARWAKTFALLPIIPDSSDDIEISRERYLEALREMSANISLRSPAEIESAARSVGIQQPFYLAYQGMNDRELQRTYGNLVCRIMSSRYPQYSAPLPMLASRTGEPLRIGIVSGFFHYHAIWKIPVKGWIENIDKGLFSLYGYYTGTKQDAETAKCRKIFHRFVENAGSFEELCETIRGDRLHVIIYPEIGMDPVTAKLASLKLAPVQCTSWGHPETTGLPTIDYFVSSEMMEPADADSHYSEKLERLPNLSMFYKPPAFETEELGRESFGLRAAAVLYHCCQSLYKHLPQHDEIFPRIAKEAGDCQFLFASYPNIPSIIKKFRMRLSDSFRRHGLDLDDYVVFLPPLVPEKYNALNRIADVYLDTIGWSGCNSVLEALSCGLPVVTRPTALMRGREAFAIFSMLGITDTVANSLDEYVEIAVRLGKDTDLRRQISKKIAERIERVYGDTACIRGLEKFLERVVRERSREQ